MAPTIIEVEKSHHLLSASWRPRKDGGAILVFVRRLEKPSEPEEYVSVQGQEKTDVPAQGNTKANSFHLHICFILGLQGIGLCPSTLGRAIYFKESTNSNANFLLKHPSSHPQKECLIWTIVGPSTLTYKMDHHTVCPG